MIFSIPIYIGIKLQQLDHEDKDDGEFEYGRFVELSRECANANDGPRRAVTAYCCHVTTLPFASITSVTSCATATSAATSITTGMRKSLTPHPTPFLLIGHAVGFVVLVLSLVGKYLC